MSQVPGLQEAFLARALQSCNCDRGNTVLDVTFLSSYRLRKFPNLVKICRVDCLNILKNIDQSGERRRGPKTLRVFCTRNYIIQAVVQIQVIVS